MVQFVQYHESNFFPWDFVTADCPPLVDTYFTSGLTVTGMETKKSPVPVDLVFRILDKYEVYIGYKGYYRQKIEVETEFCDFFSEKVSQVSQAVKY